MIHYSQSEVAGRHKICGQTAALSAKQLLGAVLREVCARQQCPLTSAKARAQLVPEAVVRAYGRAMLNIHPALLPAFGGKGLYGARVHRAVLASGARWSGPSVHFVDNDYDTGPILAQRVVPVLPTDSPAQLAARVLAQARRCPTTLASACVSFPPAC